MEKLVATDPVGAYHGLIKYARESIEARSVSNLCRQIDPNRFHYNGGEAKRYSFIMAPSPWPARCSFCKKKGHRIFACRILARVTCGNCKLKGHRASHCINVPPFVKEISKVCEWRPPLLARAFTRAILTRDLAWLDEVLQESFYVTVCGWKLVIGIRDRAFRNAALSRLFDWLEPQGQQQFMRYVAWRLDVCIQKLARGLPAGRRRFVSGTSLEACARDLRYIYTLGLLRGAEPVKRPNYSFLKAVGKPCRRLALPAFPSNLILPELVLLVIEYLYV